MDVRCVGGELPAERRSHLLLLARCLVLCRDVDDPVCVDVERDLDLGHAAGRRGDADQVELAEHLVVGGHLALALQDLDANLTDGRVRGNQG